jgi:hypothetical protein
VVFDSKHHGSGTELARRSTGKFSFVDTLASLIVNRSFSKGYEDFARGKDTRDSFVFETLSAIGNDIGDALYQNVLHYIDAVSNVDTCKVSALKSMMGMYGLKYEVFEEIGMLPVELQDMMDIFSINRKYLMKNGFLNENLLSDLISSNIIVEEPVDDTGLSVSDTFDDEAWDRYLKDAYSSVMTSFLTMDYVDAGGFDQKSTIGKSDSFQEEYLSGVQDRYAVEKKEMNVPPSFSPIKSVDMIENGYAELSDFHGSELSLVNEEIAYRIGDNEFTNAVSSDGSTKEDIALACKNRNRARYSYYRRQKVLEYAKFIDNKIYHNETGIDDFQVYDIDNSYFNISQPPEKHVIAPDGGVDGKMVAGVADSLVSITRRIMEIREKMKVQTRKNYMKGSSNLLSYLVNDFLIEYAESRQLSSLGDVGSIRDYLSAHSAKDVEIIEYYDTTEYFNIRNENTANAQGGDDANERFWEDDGEGDKNDLDCAFTKAEIEKFYLSTLNTNPAQSRTGFYGNPEYMYDFLCALYDIGADPCFVDLSGTFHCQLSNGAFTYNIQPHFNAISTNWDNVLEYMVSGYQFPEGKTLLEQAEDFLLCAYEVISAEHLSGVSAIWDRNFDRMNELSVEFGSISSDFDNVISSFDYKTYFDASENKYCYDDYDEDAENRPYNSEYEYHFIRDAEMSAVFPDKYPYWQTDEYYKYFEIRMTKLRNFTQDFIENYPLKTMVDDIKFMFLDLSGTLMTDVIVPIEGQFGFTDPRSVTIPGEMDVAIEFLNKLCDQRRTQVLQALNAFKDTLDNLYAQFQEFERGANGVIEGYASLGVETMSEICPFGFVSSSKKQRYGYDLYRVVTNPAGFGGDDEEPYDYYWGYTINDDGTRNGGSYYSSQSNKDDESDLTIVALDLRDQNNFFVPSDALDIDELDCEIREDDTTETRLRKIRSWVEHATKFKVNPVFVKDPNAESGDEYQGEWKIKSGSLVKPVANEAIKTSCSSYLAMLGQIESSMQDIMVTASEWGVSPSGDDIGSQIASLLNSVNQLINSPDLFADDEYINAYNEYITRIYELSGEYNPIYQDYKNIQNDEEQKVYIADFILQTDLTEDVLDRLLSYIKKRDRNARKELSATEDRLDTEYNDLNNSLDEFCIDLATEFEEIQFSPSHGYFEESYAAMLSALEVEIRRKFDRAMEKILEEEAKISGYMDAVLGEFNSYWPPVGEIDDNRKVISTLVDISTVTDILSDAVESRREELDFYEYPEYLERYAYFLTYTGTDDSSDPYYNSKNTAHASYQIHPYLSSFVETKIFDKMVLASYNTGIIDELRDEKIAENISGFIGDFGETIGKWFYDARDWSGYRSRYETSPHEIRVRNKYIASPLVDFDGPFYPPAIDYIMLHKADEIISDVLCANAGNYVCEDCNHRFDLGYDHKPGKSCPNCHGTNIVWRENDTFYSRFYSHLSLPEDQRIRISKQLEKYLGDIKEVAGKKDVEDGENGVYDIWKYGIDIYNNSIILYKKYPREGMTYAEKRDVPGHVWIRLADHPLAFPAFYGNEQEEDSENNITISEVYSAANTMLSSTHTDIPRYMNDKANPCVFDMEMNEDDQIIAFAANCPPLKNTRTTTTTEDVPVEDSDPDIDAERSWNHPDILVAKITMVKWESNKYDDPCFITREGSNRSVDIEEYARKLPLSSDQTFEGFCKPGDSNLGFCYITNDENGNISGDSTINGKLIRHTASFTKFDVYPFVLPCPGGFEVAKSDVFSYSYADEEYTFAFKAVRSIEDTTESIKTKHNSESPNYPESTFPPTNGEWNSFDSFEEYLAVIRGRFVRGKFKTYGTAMANLNADASYTPHYPGLSGELSLTGENYSAVELLGVSKDIDEEIGLVNPNPNPYFDIDDIRKNYVFGRVYENYNPDEDKTLAIIKNPLLVFDLYKNHPIIGGDFDNLDDLNAAYDLTAINSVYGDAPQEGHFATVGGVDYIYDGSEWRPAEHEMMWTIELPGVTKNPFTSRDYERMSFFLFNSESKGKNPYYIGELTALAGDDWTDLYYMSESPGAEVRIEGTSVRIAGTYNCYTGVLNSDDTNRLPGIVGVKAKFDQDTKTLKIRFMMEDEVVNSFISRNRIIAVFANPKDLTMFQYYHLLDAYGMYKSEHSMTGFALEPPPPTTGVVSEGEEDNKFLITLEGWKLLPNNSYWDW